MRGEKKGENEEQGRGTEREEGKRQVNKDKKCIIVIGDRAIIRLAVNGCEGFPWERHCSKTG